MTSLLYFGAVVVLVLVCILISYDQAGIKCPKCGAMMSRVANAGWGMSLYICPICKKYFYEDEVG